MDRPSQRIEVVQARTQEQLQDVRALFDEYWKAFAFDPGFQDFDKEIAALPGDYAPPAGRLALALALDGGPPRGRSAAGCIALRRLPRNRCEMKRLYVRDAFRGRSVGLTLIEWLLTQARAIGYEEMYLDTMPSMRNAIALYERLGFTRCDAYAETTGDDTTCTLCYKLKL